VHSYGYGAGWAGDGCSDTPYSNDAYFELSDPVHQPDVYTLQSDHWVITYFLVFDPDTGEYEYYNPEGFESGEGGSGGSGIDFGPGDGSVYLVEEEAMYRPPPLRA
jgi:hypothetical protein